MKSLQLQVVKNDRLYMKVAEQLRGLIENDTIKPGERFPSERELAEQLGVSRPTVREAMIALEMTGVIEIRSGSGIYALESKPINSLTLDDTGIGPFEILEIRQLIESEACALAASRITSAELDELRQAVRDMEEEEKRPDASEKADQRFHEIIARSCQNSAIESVVSWLWKLRNESMLSTSFLERIRSEGIHPSISEHQAILTALEQRDPIAARNSMKKHIESATENAARHFQK
ncbi:FadR/GntR family transcriptional regulator [Glaciecola sp. KUL10]|uniref:FadR/GntR family transcriptional regulator n=1 Tax=Glaciecola sp. (strain KUL10) TaxID=2161813 RepID=UPI000D8E8E41|nr:FadR/GntR family transcriptional regulator [Glaciecola sp. KUL10]GBL05954.1 GntR family transcriptional regulator [Glaciecola sp. KUL10]